MRMQGGNHNVVRFVLEVGELFRQWTSVMIVDEGDRADDQCIRRDHYRAHESVTN
jgi:hypothetical protein